MTTHSPPWLLLAEGLRGVKETPGRDVHPFLAYMAQRLELTGFQDDEDPWCTGFISFLFRITLSEEPLPKATMWSRAYQRWGVGLVRPVPGCVVVSWRGESIEADLGHASLYLETTSYGFHRTLGGNVENGVGESLIAPEKIVPGGFRWPRTYPLPPEAEVAQPATRPAPGITPA